MRLGAGTAMGGGQWTALTSYPVGSTGMDTAGEKGSASAGVVTGSGGDGVAFAAVTVTAGAVAAEEWVQASRKRRCSKRVDSL